MSYTWGNNRRFHSQADQNKQKYGTRIQKVSLNAGFSCPNRDGTIGKGGCTFCNNEGFSPSYCHEDLSITDQINKGLTFLKTRYKKARLFMAYFQAYSNTHDRLEVLKKRYSEALRHPEICGLSIGTRPDCIDNEKLEYLAQLACEKIIHVEYGVESCYDATLLRVNRGHTFSQSREAIEMTAEKGLHTTIHIIMGLPGETAEMMLEQAKILSELPINSIKFHQLQIVKNTAMAVDLKENPGQFRFFETEEYIDFMVAFLERLRPDIAIERFAGEVPPSFNLRPSWRGLRSDQIMTMIEKQLEYLNTWQGKKYRS